MQPLSDRWQAGSFHLWGVSPIICPPPLRLCSEFHLLFCWLSRKTNQASHFTVCEPTPDLVSWNSCDYNSLQVYSSIKKEILPLINKTQIKSSPLDYSLSNVIVADEKSTSFLTYLTYSHKHGVIAFSTPSAILWAYSHIANMISAGFSLFEHAIYSWGALHCLQCRVPQE